MTPEQFADWLERRYPMGDTPRTWYGITPDPDPDHWYFRMAVLGERARLPTSPTARRGSAAVQEGAPAMNNVSFAEAVRRANSIFRYRAYLRRSGRPMPLHMTLRTDLREWCWRFYYEWSRGP